MKIKFIIPKIGDSKIVRKFLWFPVSIDREIRWLEYATVRYKYSNNSYKVGMLDSWIAIEFINEGVN